MQRLRIFIFIFFPIISFRGIAQHADLSEVKYSNSFDDPSKNTSWINSNTIVMGTDTSRKYISKTDAQNPYSAGIEVEIPEQLKRKNFRISVMCNVNKIPGVNNQLVISIAKSDSAVYWDGFQIDGSNTKLSLHPIEAPGRASDSRSWYTLNMSSLIPGNIPIDSKIKIYVWNADGKSETDVDDMEITFTETPLTSFLPK